MLASSQLFTNGSGYWLTSFFGVSPGREGIYPGKRANVLLRPLQER